MRRDGQRDAPRKKGWSVAPEIDVGEEELGRLKEILPAPEPEVVPPRAGGGRVIPVSETRLDGNELRYLSECVESNWISSAGPFVSRFEAAFAAAVGCRHGVACSSGTAALHLALSSLGLGLGDEVIVPAFTMIATANAVRYTGATPVFADAEAETWNVDPGAVSAKVGPRTRGIIAVHTYGHPADMDALRRIAERHGLFLFEDAAEAHGARLGGRPVGSLGDAATFSFYGNKIVSCGEGGMVTTNDGEVAATARHLRDHAFSSDRHFWHKRLGFNYRMSNLQAAVGLAQTERLPEFVEARRTSARLYHEKLREIPGLTLPPERRGTTNVFWMYALLVGDGFGISRDALRQRLARRGIETRSFFVPLHIQPVYFGAHRGERYPVAEELCRTGLYLASGPALSARDIDRIAEEIRLARPA